MFRTIELPSEQFTFEGLMPCTVKSRALRRRVDFTLWQPARFNPGTRDVPIIILLHGAYGSHWAWSLKGAAHRTAKRLIDLGDLPPCVLAMPSDGLAGDGTAFTGNVETWVASEVPAAINAIVDETSPSSPLFIAGNSMGGFGALRIALRHPARFRAAAAHSALTHFDQLSRYIEEPIADFPLSAEERDLYTSIFAARVTMPPFRFDCGSGDTLFGANRELHERLTAAGIVHEYSEHDGGHDWAYWEMHIEDTLRFFARFL